MNMNGYFYRVAEKQDSESVGEPGEPFEAFNLSEAKRISTRRQKVKGSVLVLEDLTGRPHVVSTKGASGKMDGRGRRGDVLLKGHPGHKAAVSTCISEALDAT